MKKVSSANYKYIDSQGKLDELVKYIEKADLIAIDTEADSLHNYSAKICLIQLTIKDRNFIIDPLADFNISDFLNAISQTALLLHSGGLHHHHLCLEQDRSGSVRMACRSVGERRRVEQVPKVLLPGMVLLEAGGL